MAADMKSFAATVFAIAIFGLASTPVAAKYPERAIKIVVPYAAGGTTDVVARLAGQALSQSLGQPVIIENRTGANGTIAERAVATADADGYTLLIDTPGAAMNRSLFNKLPFDLEKDLRPVAQLIAFPFMIVASENFKAQTLSELIKHAKERPSEINTAVSGSSTQLVTELFRLQADIKLTNVTYRGGAPATLAVMANEVQLMISDLPNVAQYVAAGKMRGLAVSSAKRNELFPNVPTALESGMKDYVVDSWFGLFVPANTPEEIVRTLNIEFNRIMTRPEIKEKLAPMGAVPVSKTPEEFKAFYRSELARWEDVVTRAGIPRQ